MLAYEYVLFVKIPTKTSTLVEKLESMERMSNITIEKKCKRLLMEQIRIWKNYSKRKKKK